MKIVVEIRHELIPVAEVKFSVELKKIGNKMLLLNIADDVTKCLLSHNIHFQDALAKYGKVNASVGMNDLTKVSSPNELDCVVLFPGKETLTAQEFLFKARTSVVVNDAHYQIAKLWLFD